MTYYTGLFRVKRWSGHGFYKRKLWFILPIQCIRKPDFPKAAFPKVTVKKNKKFNVGDNDFSKESIMPDVIQVHSIPEGNHKEDGENSKCNKNAVGNWDSGKVFYSIVDMTSQGSSAMLEIT